MKQTSISIQRKIIRLRSLTAHISPYVGGLAPETRTFVVELNAESKRRSLGVKYLALANRIEAKGNINRALRTDTLGGWFLRRAISDGYEDGEGPVLRRGNSAVRKRLRKREKTKAGIREKDSLGRAIERRLQVRGVAEAGDAYIGPASIIPAKWPKAWINGVYMPILHPHRPREID